MNMELVLFHYAKVTCKWHKRDIPFTLCITKASQNGFNSHKKFECHINHNPKFEGSIRKSCGSIHYLLAKKDIFIIYVCIYLLETDSKYSYLTLD